MNLRSLAEDYLWIRFVCAIDTDLDVLEKLLARVRAEALEEAAKAAAIADNERISADRIRELAKRSGLLLPGRFCPQCHAFNGDLREKLLVCRCCGAERPKPPPPGHTCVVLGTCSCGQRP